MQTRLVAWVLGLIVNFSVERVSMLIRKIDTKLRK